MGGQEFGGVVVAMTRREGVEDEAAGAVGIDYAGWSCSLDQTLDAEAVGNHCIPDRLGESHDQKTPAAAGMVVHGMGHRKEADFVQDTFEKRGMAQQVVGAWGNRPVGMGDSQFEAENQKVSEEPRKNPKEKRSKEGNPT